MHAWWCGTIVHDWQANVFRCNPPPHFHILRAAYARFAEEPAEEDVEGKILGGTLHRTTESDWSGTRVEAVKS